MTIAAYLLENDTAASILLFLAAAVICASIATHDELKDIYRLTLIVALLGGDIWLIQAVQSANLEHRLHKLDGPLLAGNDPLSSEDACSSLPASIERDHLLTPKEKSAFIMSANVVVAAPKLHWGKLTIALITNHLAIVEADGKELISVDKEDSGISISTEVFDKENKIVSHIEKNYIRPITHGVSDFYKPDESTLIEKDEHDNEILRIRRNNTHDISLIGEYYYNGLNISVDNLGIKAGSTKIQFGDKGACYAVTHAVIDIVDKPQLKPPAECSSGGVWSSGRGNTVVGGDITWRKCAILLTGNAAQP